MSHITRPTSETPFTRLFAEHAGAIRAHVLTLVFHEHDADEVFQETCTTLLQKFDQYQAGTDFRAWACRIAYYKVLKLRERQMRSPQLFSRELLEAVDEELIVMSDELDTRSDALARCREKLNERDRQLLSRYYSDGATAKRVAQILRWSTDKLYRTLRRIHDQLFDCIRRTLAEERNG